MKYVQPPNVTLVQEKQECNTKAHPRARWETQVYACYRAYLPQHSAVESANTFTVEVPNQPSVGWKIHTIVKEGVIVEAPFQARNEPVRLLVNSFNVASLLAHGPLETQELSFVHFADSTECELAVLSALDSKEHVAYQDVVFFKDLKEEHEGSIFKVLGDRNRRVAFKSPLDGSMSLQVEMDANTLLVNQRCVVSEGVLQELKARMLRTHSNVQNHVFNWDTAQEALPILSARTLKEWLDFAGKYSLGFQVPKVHDTRIKPFLESLPDSFFQHLPNLPEEWCEQLNSRSAAKIHGAIRRLVQAGKAFGDNRIGADFKMGFCIFRKRRQLYVQILNSHRITLAPIEVASESQALYVLEQVLSYFELGIKVAHTDSGYIVKAVPPALQ